MGFNAVRISQQNMERSYAVRLFLMLLSCFACVVLSGVEARARACSYVPETGGESLSVRILPEFGEEVKDGSVVLAGTWLIFHSVAEAYGQCFCPETRKTYFRTVHHTTVSAEIWADGLGGNFTLGHVYGYYPEGGTAFWQVLDTTASNNTGPIFFRVTGQGTYQFHIRALINTTRCNIQPDMTETVSIKKRCEEPRQS